MTRRRPGRRSARAAADVERLSLDLTRLNAVFEEAPAGLVIAEAPSGRLLRANRRSTEIFGDELAPAGSTGDWAQQYQCHDLEGRPVAATDWPLARAVRGESVGDVTLACRRGDGPRHVLQISASPLRDASGRVAAAVAGFVDVSERVRAEEELREAVGRFRSLVDSVDGIVWEADASFRFQFVSERAERLLGYPRERWREEGFWADHLHPDDRREAVAFCVDRTARCEDHDFEYRMIAADGRTVWLRDIVTVVREPGPVRLRGVMVDITARKHLEAERERWLERERVARGEAEAALRLRDEFLAVAAHELRTPIAALRLRLGLVERRLDAAPEAGAGVRDLVRGTSGALDRLTRLVDELLDVVRIREGALQLHRREVDLSRLVHEALATYGELFSAAGCPLTVRVREGVRGWCDPVRFEQVLVNLLSNAAKFCRRGEVEVELDGDEQQARLVVRDHGVGIALADQSRLFQPFERAVSSRSYGGLGLGLFVSRSIVEAHGGTIRVQSEPGRGATFTVLLPIGPPTAPFPG